MKTERLLKYGFVVPTGEYAGGLIGGFGLGVLITTYFLSSDHRIHNALVWIGPFVCIAVGSTMARAAQRKRFPKELSEETPNA
jgi:hypothetical protein